MSLLSKMFGKTKPQQTRSATLHRSPDGLYVLRISGVLNKATVDNIQAVGARDFERGVTDLKLLMVLTDFLGWRRGDDWGDIDFFAEHEQDVAKIAVVGDARWETETLMFLAAGHRKGEVRYFTRNEEEKARAWLAN